MAQITVLTSKDHAQTKTFKDGIKQTTGFATLFNVSLAQVYDLRGLAELLSELEGDKQSSIIRGTLADEKNTNSVLRRSNSHPFTFKPQDCQWLCIDIDDLPLPSKFDPLTDHLEDIAIYTASHLPKEFEGVNFYFQFSSSMGIKSGIRIHLWFWLDRPINDLEAKAWLGDAKTNIDLSLFQTVQVHYTAAPIFDPPEQDPLPQRSGLVRFENNTASVSVPMGLQDLSDRKRLEQRTAIRPVNKQGHIDHERIVRDENGIVINGREQFLFFKSVDAIRELTKGIKNLQKFNDLDTLSELTWELFSAEADTSDGRWTMEDAREKAKARLAELLNGWLPNSRFETTALIPELDPYFNYTLVDRETGGKQLTDRIHGFFEDVLGNSEEVKKLALRITMGSGKTTVAVDELKKALKYNPNLNIEIYVPRHDLINELLELLDERPEGVEVVGVRGRVYDSENGNAPCQRHEYVKSLEVAGLSVRSNACIRSDDERCEFLSECAYWRQFSKSTLSTGSVRIFPHAYLSMERDDQLPEPDITIIDESFFKDGCTSNKISEGRLRTLLNEYLGKGLGDVLVNSLRDKTPSLQLLREHGLSSNAFDPSILDDEKSNIGFEASKTDAPTSELQNNKDIRTAQSILQVIAEELQQENRQEISRLRYDSNGCEIQVDYFKISHVSKSSHLLVLDATADPIILNKVFGDIEFERIDIHQQANVTQVYDKTGSNMSWGNEDNIEDLILMLEEHSSIGEKTLCISHKSLSDELDSKGFPDNLKFEYFNNIRGIDAYKEFDTIFITGRNQPPQSGVDGYARALFWDEKIPLQHDLAAELNAPTELDLPIQARGYFLADFDEECGVNVRSFTDGRIEAIHQQLREAETVQAIARLRLVYSNRIKYVYLLGNLPIEMPINNLVQWNDLAPNTAEKELISRGNIPLTPAGWQKMRPDIATSNDRAKYINKSYGLNSPEKLFKVSPLATRLGCWIISFRSDNGRTQKHLFRSSMKWDKDEEIGDVAIAKVPLKEWKEYLEQGDPEIENSGWGNISEFNYDWLTPDTLIPYENLEEEDVTEGQRAD